MRIALLAVLAFAGLWLVALRPKPGGPAAPPPPAAKQKPAKPAKGVTGAAAKADKAAAEANAATTKRETTAKKTSAGAPPAVPVAKPKAAAPKPAVPAPVTPAKPAVAAATAKPAAPVKADEVTKGVKTVLADVEKGKVVVLLFWNRKLDDDREVRRAVGAVDRRDGKVSVRLASIDDLGDYEPITRGVPVVTTPTTLVIDRDRRARAVSGLTVTREIDQLVGRALAGK